MIDNIFNGMLVDWFEKNYVVMTTQYNNSTHHEIITYRPDWSKVKLLFSAITISFIVLLGVFTFIATKIYATRVVRAKLRAAAVMTHEYILSDNDAAEIFPEEFEAFAVQMNDIKEKMQYHEKALQEETQRKNDLITYLAHDLKTPLTSVIGFLSLLREAPDMPLKLRIKYINIAFKRALRLENLINEFFDITRFNLHQTQISADSFDLSYLLLQLSDELFPFAHRHKNTITLDIPDELPMIGDADKLARVFDNILKNAISYSDPHTKILIRAHTIGDHIQVRMTNSGPTIPPEKLDQIFEKFFRLDVARSSETGGAGLGLAIAREIVLLHHGTIKATSEDHTTSFMVTLPKAIDLHAEGKDT